MWGKMNYCEDCKTKYDEEEGDDEDVNSGGSDGEDYSTNVNIANM